MGILAGLDADVFVTGTPSVALGGAEACTNVDSGTWKRYRAATHFYWDKTQTFTVQTSATGSGGWSTASPSLYTVEYPGGYIVFASALTNHFVQISAGSYFPIAQLAQCHNWQLDMKAAVVDTTVFQSSAWGSSQSAMLTASGKIDSFISDGTLDDSLAQLMIFALYLDKSANLRMECFGWLTDLTPKAAMSGVVEKAIGFTTDGAVYYRTTA